MATQVLKAWEKKELMTSICWIDPIIDSRKEKGVGAETLKQFFNMSSDQLRHELLNSEHVESGFKKQDFALALLTQFHYFPLERVLVKGDLQKREILFENEGGEKIPLILFAGLKEPHFQAVKHFFDTELWPLSTEGLIFELKRQGAKAAESLKRSLFATAEFQRLQRIFEASNVVMEPENILSVLLLSDEVDLTSVRSLRMLLRPLLERRSKHVASLYFWMEPDLFSLTDGQVLELLDLVDLSQPWVLEGLKKIAESNRSDEVLLKAKSCLTTTPIVQASKTPEDKKIFHKVEPKQTLWQIARQYRVSVEEIALLNQITPSQVLSVGKELEIPSSSSSTRSIPPG
ncbi:MAG: LysM peptidoglycan-binding domain-containing protein [Chlamydiia bacterium]